MAKSEAVQRVLKRMQEVKRISNGWTARCPSHDDRHPSLSIGTGADGRILLKCHAGCSADAIVSRIGLELRDLFPPSPRLRGAGRRDGARAEYARPAAPKADTSPKNHAEPPRNLEREAEFARNCRDDLNADENALVYMWRRRGIGPATACAWGVGVAGIRRDATGAIISAIWTLPILSHVPPRPLIGVKLHRDPPRPGQRKAGWLVGGGAALFPLPEAQPLQPGAQIVLAPGELKALAYVEAGLPATSPTTGEATRWTRNMAERFSGLAVVIDRDREDSKAARNFVANAVRALSHLAASVETTE